jgi:hypothetical protein
MALKEITENEKDALRQMYEFAEEFAEGYADYWDNCDATKQLKDCLPLVKSIIKKLDKPAKRTPKPQSVEELILTNPELKCYIDAKVRWARESRNPNYKYCVTDGETTRVWLTDDYDKALQFAKTQSITNEDDYVVYSIQQMKDKTYKLKRECFYTDGDYMAASFAYELYLHYDYVAAMVGETNIFKIE